MRTRPTILRRRRAAGDVRYGELRVTGSERPAPDELWAAAATGRSTVLLSVSHGVGVPRAGNAAAGRGGAVRRGSGENREPSAWAAAGW
jgi:hypothetical protein